MLRQPTAEVQTWMADALATAEQPRDAYLRAQAGLLGIELPPDETLAPLRLPAQHERWAELPPTAGWAAYYKPLEWRVAELEAVHGAGHPVLADTREEIAVWRAHGADYAYRFFVAGR